MAKAPKHSLRFKSTIICTQLILCLCSYTTSTKANMEDGSDENSEQTQLLTNLFADVLTQSFPGGPKLSPEIEALVDEFLIPQQPSELLWYKRVVENTGHWVLWDQVVQRKIMHLELLHSHNTALLFTELIHRQQNYLKEKNRDLTVKTSQLLRKYQQKQQKYEKALKFKKHIRLPDYAFNIPSLSPPRVSETLLRKIEAERQHLNTLFLNTFQQTHSLSKRDKLWQLKARRPWQWNWGLIDRPWHQYHKSNDHKPSAIQNPSAKTSN